jgi:hypothetical protein
MNLENIKFLLFYKYKFKIYYFFLVISFYLNINFFFIFLLKIYIICFIYYLYILFFFNLTKENISKIFSIYIIFTYYIFNYLVTLQSFILNIKNKNVQNSIALYTGNEKKMSKMQQTIYDFVNFVVGEKS